MGIERFRVALVGVVFNPLFCSSEKEGDDTTEQEDEIRSWFVDGVFHAGV